jgi:hypothetical protein
MLPLLSILVPVMWLKIRDILPWVQEDEARGTSPSEIPPSNDPVLIPKQKSF